MDSDDEEVEDDGAGVVPEMFEGDAGEQAIQYMQQLLDQVQLTKKRGKGKAPSSEHPSNGGGPPPAKKMRILDDTIAIRNDPTYRPGPETAGGRPSTRGRGRGRPRGRGRGNTSSSMSISNSLNNSSATNLNKGQHWRDNELAALILGANHLKPVLKGRFKSSSDGVQLKKLAWEELTGKL